MHKEQNHAKPREVLAPAPGGRLLAGAGLLPTAAQAAWNAAAFEAKTMADAGEGLGGGAPVESKDVTITGPDIAENGAVVPVGAPTTLPGVKRCCCWSRRTPACWPRVRRHRRVEPTSTPA
jgi:predicted secreted protein